MGARRASRSRSLTRALGLAAVLGGLLGLLAAALVLPGSDATGVLVLYLAVYAVFFAAGLIAWGRRPGNPTGAIIVAGALAVLLGCLANATVPAVSMAGALFGTTVFAVVVHLLLSFPSGRLPDARSRATVIAGYFVSTVLQVPVVLAQPGSPGAAALVQGLAGAAVMAVTAAILVARLRRADTHLRRLLLPLASYGIVAVLAVPVSAFLLDPAAMPAPHTRAVVQLLLLAGVPIAFAVGVLRGGFVSSGELVELSDRLSELDAPRGIFTQALAHTLGDDSMRLGFAVDDGWVDEHGDALVLERASPGRGQVPVTVGDRLVATIDYDAQMLADPDHVRRAGQIVAIGIDRARLSVELRNSRAELLESRARLVEAGDRARLRIAQDLHDGLQVQLVLLALEAQELANAADTPASTSERATELRRHIDAAAADVRRLAHDVLPLSLVERGLADALEDLADRMPVATVVEGDLSGCPLPVAVTTTAYFVVAEALANVVKHAGARHVRVQARVAEGTLHLVVRDDGRGGAAMIAGRGLRGLADRVAALGGAFAVTSTATGTEITAELPCGS